MSRHESLGVEIKTRREVGIEVWPKTSPRPVRPLYKVVEVRIPDGEIDGEEWDTMSRAERYAILGKEGRVQR